jgi:hypothetical protein
MFRTLVERQINTKLSFENIIRKVLKLKCSNYLHIVHLYMICMSYDKKKRRESNYKFEFDSRPQIF